MLNPITTLLVPWHKQDLQTRKQWFRSYVSRAPDGTFLLPHNKYTGKHEYRIDQLFHWTKLGNIKFSRPFPDPSFSDEINGDRWTGFDVGESLKYVHKVNFHTHCRVAHVKARLPLLSVPFICQTGQPRNRGLHPHFYSISHWAQGQQEIEV